MKKIVFLESSVKQKKAYNRYTQSDINFICLNLPKKSAKKYGIKLSSVYKIRSRENAKLLKLQEKLKFNSTIKVDDFNLLDTTKTCLPTDKLEVSKTHKGWPNLLINLKKLKDRVKIIFKF